METLVPDDLWTVIEPLLPPGREKPIGGRPPASDRAALAGIVLVLRTGLQWKHLPRSEVGCSGKASWRRLGAWQAAGRPGRPAPRDAGAASGCRPARRVAGRPRQRQPAGPNRGSASGPNPTDRGKPGTERHRVVDANGTPLGLTLTGSNGHDSRMLAATLDAVPGCAQGVVVAHGADRTSCTPTRATTIAAAGARAEPAASRPGLPGAAPRAANGWGAIAGSLSARSLGSPASAGSPSAPSAAPPSISPSPRSPAP